MSPVLNYFGIPARGEATRVALAVAGVDFEDKRMSFAEFGASEFKTVPVYQVRNKKKNGNSGRFTRNAGSLLSLMFARQRVRNIHEIA